MATYVQPGDAVTVTARADAARVVTARDHDVLRAGPPQARYHRLKGAGAARRPDRWMVGRPDVTGQAGCRRWDTAVGGRRDRPWPVSPGACENDRMPPPILLTVDDDPEVSRSLARDLRQQYGEEYRIRRAESGGGRPRRPQGVEAPGRAGGLAARRSTDARDDRRRVPGAVPQPLPQGPSRPSHRLRRHRRRHCGHQPG